MHSLPWPFRGKASRPIEDTRNIQGAGAKDKRLIKAGVYSSRKIGLARGPKRPVVVAAAQERAPAGGGLLVGVSQDSAPESIWASVVL